MGSQRSLSSYVPRLSSKLLLYPYILAQLSLTAVQEEAIVISIFLVRKSRYRAVLILMCPPKSRMLETQSLDSHPNLLSKWNLWEILGLDKVMSACWHQWLYKEEERPELAPCSGSARARLCHVTMHGSPSDTSTVLVDFPASRTVCEPSGPYLSKLPSVRCSVTATRHRLRHVLK